MIDDRVVGRSGAVHLTDAEGAAAVIAATVMIVMTAMRDCAANRGEQEGARSERGEQRVRPRPDNPDALQ